MRELKEIPRFWRRPEIPIADYLMSHQQALRDEFMAGFNTLEEAIKSQGTNTLDRPDQNPEEASQFIRTKDEAGEFKPSMESWKNISFKYEHPDEGLYYEIDQEVANKFPTAYKLIKKFGKDCPIANYSCLAPNSVIQRHTGPENRHGEFIRIHIPLIIPEGDVFFECNGEEITWSDIWGFNNQLPHSAHNYTDKYRLAFLIDLRRIAIGMEPGPKYSKRHEVLATPFVRHNK
jgi:Aspartyl/Asparaginyl beta-hydroxylase